MQKYKGLYIEIYIHSSRNVKKVLGIEIVVCSLVEIVTAIVIIVLIVLFVIINSINTA